MGSVAASPEIAIIGAGIVGLAVAHGLISRSLGNVTVYEQSSALQENGAGVAFTKNAVECMHLLSPRATEALRAVATHSGDKDDPNEWLQWLDGQGGGREAEVEEVMMRLWVGKNGFEGCHRQHFLMGLLERLPVDTVKFNTRVVKVVEGGEGEKIKLQFSDGSDVRVDAGESSREPSALLFSYSFGDTNCEYLTVIGCDGIKSRIRRLLLEDEYPECCAPQYTHKVAYRTLIPMDAAISALGEETARNQNMHIGPQRHVLHFPVAGQTLLNVVAFDTDPNPWVEEKNKTTGTQLVSSATRDEIVRAFGAWSKPVRNLLSLFPEKTTKWGIFDTCEHPCPFYAKGPICIVGDAAHASSPHHGAGAGVGIEDSLCLVTAIEDAFADHRGGGDISAGEAFNAAFSAYDEARRERSQWLVKSSREVSEIYEMTYPDTGHDMEKCLKEIERRSHKIWYFNYELMLKETRDGVETRLCASATRV